VEKREKREAKKAIGKQCEKCGQESKGESKRLAGKHRATAAARRSDPQPHPNPIPDPAPTRPNAIKIAASQPSDPPGLAELSLNRRVREENAGETSRRRTPTYMV